MSLLSPLYSWIIYPVIYIFPAYVANGAPVIFGGGRPLDLGRKLFGKPIFGKHKTIRGTVLGILSGCLIGGIESAFIPYMLVVGILLSLGTHAGDLAGSFIKRRLGRKEGQSSVIMDQYMFLIFALLFALPAGHLPGILGILFLAILTGILHKSTNMVANKAKIKEVPW